MTPLAALIRAEIAQAGPLPFARFMELALYQPEFGYYERQPSRVGRTGDFITSVSVGRLFGELLARQFAAWLDELDANHRLQIVEAGAHDGRLAADILGELRARHADLFARVDYVLVEPSPRRRGWQERQLADLADRVRWQSEVPAGVRGVIFGNELLDAFPVHRLGWDAARRTWFEWRVSTTDTGFVQVRSEGAVPPALLQRVAHLAPELLAMLPDGFTVEAAPAAEVWWRTAATNLAAGRLLAVDYGLTDLEFFAPSRCDGSLRAYADHHLITDTLANPGEQDLTAHVNFSALQAAGEAAGLRTEALLSQAQFLTRIAAKEWAQTGLSAPWDSARVRQFQTLTHPEHLGRAFRVLIQRRG